MPVVRFVLVNEGQQAPLAAQVTADWLTAVAAACTVQLNRDVSTYWGGAYSVRVGSGPTDIGENEIAFALLDSLPNAPGAIAYHNVAGNAVPYAVLGLDTCSTLDDVSTAVSHELCETAGDAACNAWRDAGDGKEYAQELCDAVESTSYDINGIKVSDFVLPSFFAPEAPGPYRYTSAVAHGPDAAAPFATTSGGYQIVRQVGGGETQVNGTVRADRLTRKRHPSSRTFRRGVRL